MSGLLEGWGSKIGQGLLDVGEFGVDMLASQLSDPYKQNLIGLNKLEREDAQLKKNRAYMAEALGQRRQMQGFDPLTQELIAEDGGDPLQQFVQQQGSGYLGSEQTPADKLRFMGQMSNSYMPGTRTAANAMMRDQMQPRPEGEQKPYVKTWVGDFGKTFGLTHEGKVVEVPGATTGKREPRELVKIINGPQQNLDLADKEMYKVTGEYRGDRLTSFQNNLEQDRKIISSMEETSKMLDSLYTDTDWTTTGLGSFAKDFPAFDAMSWAEKKQTIVSRLALGKMMELKAASPSGATGFGALSERELNVLETEFGSLKQAQSEGDIKIRLYHAPSAVLRFLVLRTEVASRRWIFLIWIFMSPSL